MKTLVLLVATCALSLFTPSAANACGGAAGPTAKPGSVGQTAQRAFYAVHPDHTELVLQVDVPLEAKSFAILVPLPAEPQIDPRPISAEDFEQLDRSTQPQIITRRSSSAGEGCGCPLSQSKASDLGAATGGSSSVRSGTPVTLGPVTATKLTADSAAALEGWLTQNGFALTEADRKIAAAYVAPGTWFVAFKPSGTSPGAVGVHLTLPGDRRGFALRMAKIGGAAQMAFTVFVSAPSAVGPGAGSRALLLTDLPAATLRGSGYHDAVAEAVSAAAGKAWVVERVGPTDALPRSLRELGDSGFTLTRLSTVVATSVIDADVTFDGKAPDHVPSVLDVSLPGAAMVPAALLLTLLGTRLSRRRRA